MQPASPFFAFLPLVIISIPVAFFLAMIAKRIGKNEVTWFLLGLIPYVNALLILWVFFSIFLDIQHKIGNIVELLKQNTHLPKK